MERKKILIIGMSLNIGGAEKSLINLLKMIDYKLYDIDLLLFQKRGDFLKQIPEEVNIIEDYNIKILFQPVSETIKMGAQCLNGIKLIYIRYFSTMIETLKWKQFDQIRLHRWVDFYSKFIENSKKEYDVAIAYAGGETAYYMIDKVSAKRKVYFFHSDYSRIDIDAELEKKYVNQADQVITVSETCKQSLIELFPEKESDITVLNNLSSSKEIWKLAQEYIPREFSSDKNVMKLVSVGRLISIKGFDMAIDAATIMKEHGIKFQWIVVGEGEERKSLEKQIIDNGLQELFQFVGLKENPYPYLLNADIVVQTSRFEGKSVVLDEAKVLKKPIVVTNYNSVQNQITDGVSGLIVEMTGSGIAMGIESCISKPELLESLKKNLENDTMLEDIDTYMAKLTGEYNV